MTTTQVKALLQHNSDKFSYYAVQDHRIGDEIAAIDPNNPENTIPVKVVGGEIFGHGEGDGEHVDVQFEIEDKIYEVTGFYNSWDSSELYLEGVREVEAYTETVTRYR